MKGSIALVLYLLLVFSPILYMFGSSMVHEGAFSLESYGNILGDARQLALLRNTIVIGAGAALLSMILGVPAGLFIARTDIPWRRPLFVLLLAPLFIPPYIHAIAWVRLFAGAGGLNSLLMKVLSLSEPPLSVYGLPGCVWIMSLSLFPVVSLFTMSGLYSIEGRMEECGRLYGSETSVFRRITLPLILPQICAGSLFIALLSIINYGVPSLLRVHTYPVEIFIRFSAQYNEQGATAASLPFVVIAITILLGIRVLLSGRAYIAPPGGQRSKMQIRLGGWRKAALIPVLVPIACATLIPLGVLIDQAGPFETYEAALRTGCRPLLLSLLTAAGAATLSLFLAWPMAYSIARGEGKKSLVVDFLSLLPFSIPPTVLGVGLIRLWNRPETSFVYGSLLILLIAFTARFIPFVIQSVALTLKQLDPGLEEASEILEPSGMRRLGRVLLPLTSKGILVGWFLAFAFSLGELGALVLVVPPGVELLSLRIYSLLHYGAEGIVAALSVALVAMALVPLLLVTVLYNFAPTSQNNRHSTGA